MQISSLTGHQVLAGGSINSQRGEHFSDRVIEGLPLPVDADAFADALSAVALDAVELLGSLPPSRIR
jgi:hypothetical protein